MTKAAKGNALNGAIKGFVTGALGCQCPDEVFETIEHDVPGDGLGGLLVRIGGRLMVRLLPVGKVGGAPRPGKLVDMLQDGRKERDRTGFNRFRLVLICGSDDELDNWGRIADEAMASFKDTVDSDDRVHIHVLTSEDVPKALGAKLGL
jgi:hypothetical protein